MVTQFYQDVGKNGGKLAKSLIRLCGGSPGGPKPGLVTPVFATAVPFPRNQRDVSGSELNVYVPILILAAIAAAFAVFSVAVAILAGPRRYNRAKLEAYECGIEPAESSPSGPHAGGQRFPVKYYLTAMLFIIFDIEIVFLYPWAVSYDALGVFALVEMLLFMLTVFVAYAYVWRRGGLSWD